MPIQEASSSSSARSSAWPAWSSAAREAAASPATAWTSEATAASQPWVSGSAAEVGRLAEAIVPPYELLVRFAAYNRPAGRGAGRAAGQAAGPAPGHGPGGRVG